jgi:hypothetical protein
MMSHLVGDNPSCAADRMCRSIRAAGRHQCPEPARDGACIGGSRRAAAHRHPRATGVSGAGGSAGRCRIGAPKPRRARMCADEIGGSRCRTRPPDEPSRRIGAARAGESCPPSEVSSWTNGGRRAGATARSSEPRRRGAPGPAHPGAPRSRQVAVSWGAVPSAARIRARPAAAMTEAPAPKTAADTAADAVGDNRRSNSRMTSAVALPVVRGPLNPSPRPDLPPGDGRMGTIQAPQDLDRETRRFSGASSPCPGPLAQLAEQRTFNPRVVGSIPTGPTAPTALTCRFTSRVLLVRARRPQAQPHEASVLHYSVRVQLPGERDNR